MGQLVRISIGEWSKSAAGCWQFEGDPSAVDKYIVARSNENINSFTSLIREELVIGPECPIGLTYQLPQRMLHGIQSTKQPSNIVTSDNVAFVMSNGQTESNIFYTIGARNVAKYQFLCRTPFNIGDFRFLDGSVTEEDHFASLRGLVGEDIIRRSDTLMTQLFSDENLILIYRLSYEIEKAREAEDVSKEKGNRMMDEVDGGENRYIHVNDDSDNHHGATPMRIERVVINDSSSDLPGNQGACEKSEGQVSLNPPASRRPPGRPRKNRLLSRGEFEMQVRWPQPRDLQNGNMMWLNALLTEVVYSDDEGVWKKSWSV
ncbi:LOW QUALITY PROTEIN: hypothetical protein HID58_023197 [Brassica napus]|uniref:Uncharacterized protein n=1 Tax=Brassica napus TaxID=3708 RepID=A0ABQ8D1H2_BRANA|nr:LOW QUALITY PROTEIN: hypothetical protein HID58_023197 [Brassica napus]